MAEQSKDIKAQSDWKFQLDNRLLILLNLDKTLSTEELHSIQNISTNAAEAEAANM